MRIAVLGGPGSGKEKQAQQLAERARVPCISVAALLRNAAQAPAPRTKSGRKSRAKPPPAPSEDELKLQLLEERLRARNAKRGFVIEGYPHNIPEAQALDGLLGMLDRPLQIAVRLEAGEQTLIKRITGRLKCQTCGAFFDRGPRRRMSVESRNKCDACGGQLATTISRVAAQQLADYHAVAEPLANYYKAQHKLRTIAADAAPDEVQQRIVDLVDLEIHPLDVKNLEAAAIEPDEHDSTIIAGGQINRIDPTEDILASRLPGEESVGGDSATATKPATAAKTVVQKPATKKTVKKPTPVRKTTAKKTATKKPAAKQSTRSANKPAAKKAARKPAKKPSTRVAKKSGHG